jgi:acyl dehydratase
MSWWEDIEIGSRRELGSYTFTEDEIIRFARKYDPQIFHLDPEAAKKSLFSGLIASGWHTAGLMMRLLVDHFLPARASLASPGIDELRWTRPVRPGDMLHLRVTIIEASRSRTKPDRGMLRSFVEVLNQHGEVVMSLKPMNLLRCRPAGTEEVR